MNFIFDLYGTLIDIWTDEERPEFWEDVSTLLGDGEEKARSVREEYLSLCKAEKVREDQEINLLLVFEKMLESRGIDRSHAPSFAEEFRRLSMVHLRCFYGVKSMLRELRASGCGVYLLSNAQSCFTIPELWATGLYQLFDGILISSDAGVKKPAPQIFDIAFKSFGITAENSVYVGNDLRDDVLGASGVGMKTVYIKTAQSGSYEGMNLPKPTYTVKNHREMKVQLLSIDKQSK